MQLLEDATVLSATDLNNFLACEHLTALDLAVLHDGLTRPQARPGQATLLAELGEAHERTYLEKLQADGYDVVTIERNRDLAAAAEATENAMWAGAKIIYQATFFDGRWVGHADFLRKVDERLEGGRWDWHYEVEDTKLARHTEPYFLLQLCYYSEHVARVQGAAARSMHVVLGNGERTSFRVDDFAAYYRDVKARFLTRLDDGTPTYPLPVGHCSLCVWDGECSARRKRDDHLSGVASITRLQTGRLNDAGITTLAALATAPDNSRPEKMVAPTFEKLRRQARLQDEQRLALAAHDPDPYRYEFIEDAVPNHRGFCLLPEPSPGDVFFDMEGDPYYDIGTGLEYLFGAYTADDETFTPFWGCDRSEHPGSDRLAEKKAFQDFIDFVMDRRERFPSMHVYHYASYEKTALQKLSLRHATREEQVDIILREEVLVDLYRVVRQALVVGQPSYSIKKIEEYYGKRGDASGVKGGDESILQFEAWLASRGAAQRNDALLDDLRTYNEYDCVSTYGLRQWLLELRAKAAAELGVEIPPYAGKTAEEIKVRNDPNRELEQRLEAKLPADFVFDRDDPQFAAVRPFFLVRHMLEYHWREDKPLWWRFHDACSKYQEDPEQLRDDSEAIIGLEPIGESLPLKQSLVYDFLFPSQLHKIDSGDAYDPLTKEKTGDVHSVTDGDEFGTLRLKRGKKFQELPFPPAIVIRSIINAGAVLEAIARFGEALATDGATRYRAAFDVLTRAVPRLHGRVPGDSLQPERVDEAAVRAVVDALDESYLFVQGPPGAGKTYLGARLIVGLIADGKRVGVMANSHKAIHNLLDEVNKVAEARGVAFVGAKKAGKDDPDTQYDKGQIVSEFKSLARDDVQLVAGTAWAFGPAAMDQRLDYLFIDEAGQVSLPAAIAAMTATRNVVLLGDPLQLSQVTHTEHPGDIGASVLEHLLGKELRPVAPDRGILLTDSYRMHPDVCSFISGLLYEGKLHSAPGRERQSVRSAGLSGTGLRYIPVPHVQINKQQSTEEAARIADEIETLLRGAVTDIEGRLRPMLPSDIIVVAPYNAHVRCIRKELESRPACAGVQVGTVDKFQGREAYVVFFATGASTPDDASRGVSFVFDRQRFNVAISRARALAVLVGSPALLAHRCGSVEDVRIANGVCRFIELAAAREEAVAPEPTGQLSLLLI